MPDMANAIASDCPAVTCLCPTYGRFKRLRDAVACFLLQDYPNKRMLVLNDAPKPIIGGGDGLPVTIINAKERYPTLGHKRQALLEAASTPLVAHWDDDDLYLPDHLSKGVQALLREGAGCVKSRAAHYVVGLAPSSPQNNEATPEDDGASPEDDGASPENDGVNLNPQAPKTTGQAPNTTGQASRLKPMYHGVHHNVFEGTMIFRRQEALESGGYPPTNSGQARALMATFERAGRLYKIPESEAITYVYRWGQGFAHISSCGNKPGASDRFAAANCDFGDGQPLMPTGHDAVSWARHRILPYMEVIRCT